MKLTSGEMMNDVTMFETNLVDACGVADVASDKSDAGWQRSAGVGVVKDNNVVAAARELFHKVGAGETKATRNNVTHFKAFKYFVR
jgi:hypothetical protein